MKISRIVQNIVVGDNDCWIWQKSCNSAGYGQLTEDKKYWLAHRYAYACVNSDLSDDLVVRHKCHNTKCCNPNHLTLGTNKDNYYDSIDKHNEASKNKRKTWIINGVHYPTIRAASKETKLRQSTIIKHTVNGVFDVDTYRHACKKANAVPKL